MSIAHSTMPCQYAYDDASEGFGSCNI
jgi:hypothetical protein